MNFPAPRALFTCKICWRPCSGTPRKGPERGRATAASFLSGLFKGLAAALPGGKRAGTKLLGRAWNPDWPSAVQICNSEPKHLDPNQRVFNLAVGKMLRKQAPSKDRSVKDASVGAARAAPEVKRAGGGKAAPVLPAWQFARDGAVGLPRRTSRADRGPSKIRRSAERAAQLQSIPARNGPAGPPLRVPAGPRGASAPSGGGIGHVVLRPSNKIYGSGRRDAGSALHPGRSAPHHARARTA